MNKKIIIISTLIISVLIIINLRTIYGTLPGNIKISIKNNIINMYSGFNDKTKIILRALEIEPFALYMERYQLNNPKIANLNNDYNVKFLPETQNGNFSLSSIKFNFKLNNDQKSNNKHGFFRPFFLEIYEDNLLLINYDGEVIYLPIQNLLKEKNEGENLKFNNLKSNLKTFRVLDTLMDENKIYLSYVTKNGDCFRYNIASSLINLKELRFNLFFKSDLCAGKNLRAGALQIFKKDGMKGLLATVGGEDSNNSSMRPQQKESDLGKILFINLENYEKEIFSLGHRTPQGLLVEEKIILATEHGPYGGDEINQIKFGKNYGWPIASYGTPYPEKMYGKPVRKFAKSHKKNSFEEPIYSFVPSIGIAGIIKIPEMFYDQWKDNYFIASLNGGSLYRTKFDESFNKLIYMERIFVGKRIRDLKFSKKHNIFLLALEDWREIGILKTIQ